MKVERSTPYALLASLDREGRRVNRELRRDIGTGWRGVLLRVADFRFLVDMDSIAEVADPLSLTRVPLADPAVLGVGNLRGLVLPVSIWASCCWTPRCRTTRAGSVWWWPLRGTGWPGCW